MDFERLTPREIEILGVIASCGNQVEAAKELGLSLQTVKNTTLNARRKTGAVSTMQLIYWLMEDFGHITQEDD